MLLLVTFFNLMILNFVFASANLPTGTIQGKVIDASTQAPLIGTNVTVVGTNRGAAANLDGSFVINKIPVGSYVLRFDFIGYQQLKKTDVIVRSGRATFINVELKMEVIKTDEISVTAGYFSESKDEPTSLINFSHEEIRRAPGSAGDVSRILMSLPSIAKVNDQSNNLIVRGGNPIENTFYVDNIEIPNINHFPHQGASGGPIGLLNVDFIQDVTFYSGGFSALYGDKLSSVMDIRFREGSRDKFDGQLDLNFTGFGGVAEGPLFKNKGSWLFSARRSYLDLVVDMFDVGSTVAPVYGDAQMKIVYDINQNHKFILLGVFSDDHNAPNRETAEENFMSHFGRQDLYQSTIGLNWRAVWGKSGYSNTSAALTSNKYDEDWYETSTGLFEIRNRTTEQVFKFRNVNHLRINKMISMEFGIEAKRLIENYDNRYGETTNDIGEPVPALVLKNKFNANKIGGFLNYVLKPTHRLTTILGLRADNFSYNKNTALSPRLSFSYQVTHKTSFTGSAGIFYQNLPLLLLGQSDANSSLATPKATHYIIGMEHLLNENTRLTLELYQKEYDNFPLDPLQPSIFIIDNSYFNNYEELHDDAEALSRGIEIMVQKKLAKDFYGLASASFFRSRYKGADGKWRNRNFDNRVTVSIEGGYKPGNKWEFSARWIYAGGVPYTPFNIEESILNHRAVFDKNNINKSRYPDYHSLNVRFDRRFNFDRSNIIFYLSVWNAYNRKNIANYFWNDKEQNQDAVYQWGVLPIFGVEYEF